MKYTIIALIKLLIIYWYIGYWHIMGYFIPFILILFVVGVNIEVKVLRWAKTVKI